MNKRNLAPSEEAYSELQRAYDFFNQELFGNRLPPCFIVHARKGRTFGYFCPDRWERVDGKRPVDEIAMNPQHFRTRTLEDVLSTLAHEMTHLEQQHFGKPGKGAWHNKAWGVLMRNIGLEPSNTGKPGGKDTGQQMTHYIINGGPFDRAVKSLITKGFKLSWADSIQKFSGLDGEDETEGNPNPKKKSKWKFTCPDCGQNIWGKSDTNVACVKDMKRMICAELEDDNLTPLIPE